MADTATALKTAFSKEQPDVILLDYKCRMPAANAEDVGLSLIPPSEGMAGDRIIMMTGTPRMKVAVHSVKLARSIFWKTFDPRCWSASWRRHRTWWTAEAFRRLRLSQRAERMWCALSARWRAATHRAITGERRTGKEVVRIDPQLQPAHQRAIIKVNCAALPRN